MTVTRLNELDDKSLEALCQKEEIDILPGMSRSDLIAALVEVYEEEEKERQKLHSLIIQIERSKFGFADDALIQTSEKPQEQELPESYEDSYCGLLLRDPDWAFCFYEIKSIAWQNYSKQGGFKGFFLQLMENQTPEINGPMNTTYRIMLDSRLGSRYIQLPKQGYYYQIEIVVVSATDRTVLTQSSIIYSPQVLDRINELSRVNDPAYLAILEASNFFETEPVKRLEQNQQDIEKSNPYRLSEWGED